MAETAAVKDAEIEACLLEIARAREDLRLALEEMKSGRIMNPLDWRSWFRRHPVEFVAAAAAAGFLLAGPARSSRKDGEPSLLDELGRAGVEAALPFLLKMLV